MHKKKFEKIKEIAEDAYNHLGSGFNEDVYERALLVAFRQEGILMKTRKLWS